MTPIRPIDLHLNRRTRQHSLRIHPIDRDDELGRELGEEYIRSVTSGQHMASEIRDEELPEEHGGPFITTPAEVELALDVDESNPLDAEVEPLPHVSVLRPR